MTATFNPDHPGVGQMLRADFMERAMVAVAERIKAAAEVTAPVSEHDAHPGRYKASFHVKSHARGGATHDRAEAIVSNDAPEAIFVEYGHHGREPYHTLANAAFRRQS